MVRYSDVMGNLVVQIIEGKMKGKHIGPRRKTYIDRSPNVDTIVLHLKRLVTTIIISLLIRWE